MKGPQLALILTGVLLNAIAQLLLKAGAGSLAGIELRAGNAVLIATRLLGSMPILAGLACYVFSVVVWILALSRVEVSVAYPMLSIGYVVNALAAWWLVRRKAERRAHGRHRRHHARRLAGGAHIGRQLGEPIVQASNFLPFTRPDRRGDHRGVAEVLRSGWITSGPKVREFEARLSQLCGGRPVRAFNSAHRRAWRSRCALAGIGAGRRSHHHAACPGSPPPTWCSRVGARPVFVDVDPAARATSTSSAIEPARSRRAPAPSCRSTWPGLPVDRDRLYAIASAAPAARDRGRGAGHRRATGPARDRQLRRSRVVQLPRQQEHHHRRRRRAWCCNDEAEARRCRAAAAAGRRRAAANWTAWTSTLAGGKFNLTDIAARIGLGQLPALDAFTAAPARAGATLLRALRSRARAASCRSADFAQSQLAHVPGAAAGARRTRDALHRRDARRTASASACTIRRCTCSRCTASSARARAISRTPSASAAASSRCRCFRRCRTATSIACCSARSGTGWRQCRLARAKRGRKSRAVNASRISRSSSRSTTRRRAAGAVRAAVSGARCARLALRGDLRQRRQPRPLGGAAARAVRSAARTSRASCCSTATSASTWRSSPASSTRAASASSRSTPTCRIRRRRSPSCSRRMDAGHDYVGTIRAAAPGRRLAPLGLALDEPAARAHHAHPHDRPGLHAARLQPRHRRRDQPVPRGQHLHPGARLHVRAATRPRSRSRTRSAPPASRSIRCTSLIRLNFDLMTGFSLVPLQMFSVDRHSWSRCSRSLFGIALVVRALVRRRRRPPSRWVFTLFAFLPSDRRDAVRPRPARRIRRPHLPAGARAAALPACSAVLERAANESCRDARAVVFAYHDVGVRCLRVLLRARRRRAARRHARRRSGREASGSSSVAEHARWHGLDVHARRCERARVRRAGARARARISSSPSTTGSMLPRAAGHRRARRLQHARLAAAEVPRPRAGQLGGAARRARDRRDAARHDAKPDAGRHRRPAGGADPARRHRGRGVRQGHRRRRARAGARAAGAARRHAPRCGRTTSRRAATSAAASPKTAASTGARRAARSTTWCAPSRRPIPAPSRTRRRAARCGS